MPTRSVSIQARVIDWVEKRIKNKPRYTSIAQYINEVMWDHIEEIEENEGPMKPHKAPPPDTKF